MNPIPELVREIADEYGRTTFRAIRLVSTLLYGHTSAAAFLTAAILSRSLVLRDRSGAVADIESNPTTPLYVHLI